MSDARPSIFSQLFRLAAPIVGINVLSVTSLAVDTAMCGRLENADTALTGLGYAVQLVFLLMVLMIGLTVGTVSLISRAYGAGDHARANHVLAQSSQLTMGVAAIVTLVGWLASPLLLGAIGATPAATAAAMDYLYPLLSGTVFYYLTILYGAAMRAVGNTRLPFLCALAANVLNVGLNYCLILGNFGFPALGLTGAAIGTVASQFVNVSLLVFALRRGHIVPFQFRLRLEALNRTLAKELYRIGSRAAADMLLLNTSFITVMGLVSSFDEIAVAAQGVGLRVQALAFVPGLGISQATGAMVGQALGARDVDRARAITRASLLMCSGLMTSLAIVFVVFAAPISQGFDVEPGTDLARYTIMWIQILGAGMFPVGIHIALSGMLSGAGCTHISLRINAVSTVLQVVLALVLGLALDFGIFGVWLSFPISFVVKALLGVWVFRRGRWAVTGLRPEIAESPPSAETLH